jgi:hypothetical protein
MKQTLDTYKFVKDILDLMQKNIANSIKKTDHSLYILIEEVNKIQFGIGLYASCLKYAVDVILSCDGKATFPTERIWCNKNTASKILDYLVRNLTTAKASVLEAIGKQKKRLGIDAMVQKTLGVPLTVDNYSDRYHFQPSKNFKITFWYKEEKDYYTIDSIGAKLTTDDMKKLIELIGLNSIAIQERMTGQNQ